MKKYVYLLLILLVAPLYACTNIETFDVEESLDIEPILIAEDEIAFLHISDTHGSDRSLEPACCGNEPRLYCND